MITVCVDIIVPQVLVYLTVQRFRDIDELVRVIITKGVMYLVTIEPGVVTFIEQDILTLLSDIMLRISG